MDELQLLSLPDIYTLTVSTEMHSYVYPKKPVNRPKHNHHYVNPAQVHNHNTRFLQHGALHARHDMNESTKQHTQIWNKLPREIRETKLSSIFKSDLKQYLLRRAKTENP